MDFGVYLVRRGRITAEQYVDTREIEAASRRKLGELALTSHKLSMRQLMGILEVQLESEKPFGQLAVELGYLSQLELRELLAQQQELSPSLPSILVEEGILDAETIATEARQFRHEMLEKSFVVR